MTRTIVLDSGPLGLLAGPRRLRGAVAYRQWLAGLLAKGVRVYVPEITDYELRRELLRAGKSASVLRLEALAQATKYLPLNTPTMRRAAELWAQTRQRGLPTAAESSIDVDVILAAQALELGVPDVVVATTNVGHLSRLVPAELWQNI